MGFPMIRYLPVLVAMLWLGDGARAANVLVFAAASTTNVLGDINRRYATAENQKILVSFGSSGMMARQIENGAPADLFVTADEIWLKYLTRKGLVAKGGSAEIARNRLVLIAPRGNWHRLRIEPGFPLADWLRAAPLAIADPGHAPAGRYAKASLTALGIWQAVTARTVRTGNVREALALVERGEAAAGIVYATDAAISQSVRLIGTFPEDSHPPIAYFAAIIAGRDSPKSRRYFEFLRSKAMRPVFRRHGFQVK
jgi:molybdate transport system substrate-binding protein